MGKTLIRAFWCLLLAAALAWLAILMWPGHPVTSWLTTRPIIAQAVAFPALLAVAGAGVLISTHDLANLAELADTAVLLRNEVLLSGEPGAVLAPENLVRAFGMNPLGGSGV